MDNLKFYILVNSISIISGRWIGDNERLCTMNPVDNGKELYLKWGLTGDHQLSGPVLNLLSCWSSKAM